MEDGAGIRQQRERICRFGSVAFRLTVGVGAIGVDLPPGEYPISQVVTKVGLGIRLDP